MTSDGLRALARSGAGRPPVSRALRHRRVTGRPPWPSHRRPAEGPSTRAAGCSKDLAVGRSGGTKAHGSYRCQGHRSPTPRRRKQARAKGSVLGRSGKSSRPAMEGQH